MQRADVVWLAIWSAAGVGFYVADCRGVALCSSARRLFRLDTRAGRAIFGLAYGTGAIVLHEHVVKRA